MYPFCLYALSEMFVEKNRAVRRHERYRVANHALVMITAVMNQLAPHPDARRISRYV